MLDCVDSTRRGVSVQELPKDAWFVSAKDANSKRLHGKQGIGLTQGIHLGSCLFSAHGKSVLQMGFFYFPQQPLTNATIHPSIKIAVSFSTPIYCTKHRKHTKVAKITRKKKRKILVAILNEPLCARREYRRLKKSKRTRIRVFNNSCRARWCRYISTAA